MHVLYNVNWTEQFNGKFLSTFFSGIFVICINLHDVHDI